MTGAEDNGRICHVITLAITAPTTSRTRAKRARFQNGCLTSSIGFGAGLTDSWSTCSISSLRSVASLLRFFTFFSRHNPQQIPDPLGRVQRQRAPVRLDSQNGTENICHIVAVECAFAR